MHRPLLNRGTPQTTAEQLKQPLVVAVPVEGHRCPCCGRGQTPKVERTRAERFERTCRCTLCGRTYTAQYETAQLLRLVDLRPIQSRTPQD